MPSPVRALVLIVAMLSPAAALAGWSLEGEGAASFKALGPAGFKIIGVTRKLTVKDEGAQLVVSINLPDLDTDNGLRNRHMLEDLEATKFPLCSLTVPAAQLKEGASNATATGTFTLHGKARELPFTYTATCAAGTCDVEGTAEIMLGDYDVKVRSYLGITVKPNVTVSTKFKVKK